MPTLSDVGRNGKFITAAAGPFRRTMAHWLRPSGWRSTLTTRAVRPAPPVV